jgi:anti-sigma factor RsiW
MTCDDARLAAFAAGDLPPDEADWVDAHLLTCDRCWESVRQAERGRLLIQTLQTHAPTGTAERVKRALEHAGPRARPERRRPLLAAAALAVACAVALLVGVNRADSRRDPTVIAALVRLASAPHPDEPAKLPSLDQVVVTRQQLGDQVIILASSRRPFPMPVGARPAQAGEPDPWVARRGRFTLLCFSGAHPSLLVGAVGETELLGLARTLGLS